MLRHLVLASVQTPVKRTHQSNNQIGQAPTTARESMTALLEPPRHLLPEIGSRAKAAGDPGTHAPFDRGQLTDSQHSDLQPFACALTGTAVEVLESTQCDVEGAVPSWLQGDLYRNGPGTWDIETKNGSVYSLAHW